MIVGGVGNDAALPFRQGIPADMQGYPPELPDELPSVISGELANSVVPELETVREPEHPAHHPAGPGERTAHRYRGDGRGRCRW